MPSFNFTGRPSVDQPWLRFYPRTLLAGLKNPSCTLRQYLKNNMPGLNEVAMHYYGADITWKEVFAQSDAVARSLRAVGFGPGDQIPAFLRAVPEFIYLLLAAEKIGASLLCRDNTLEENVEAVKISGAKTIIAHNFLSQEELEAYLTGSSAKRAILLDPCQCCRRQDIPGYVQVSMDANYAGVRASGPATMNWSQFLSLGKTFGGKVEAPADIDRPLLRAYTSGSTGPSKQVIHSARTMLGVVQQLNLYGASDSFRPTWLLTVLPPSLVAVVVSMMLMPLASNKLLILDPFCDVYDLDLEFMRYRPNLWPTIPMFVEVLLNSKRIPEDYDMSHLLSCGTGAEAVNNTQIRRIQKFFDDHNCKFTFAGGYGSSEAGSSITFPLGSDVFDNGNMGVPMPLTTISIFKHGTQKELTYNETGEICVSSPGAMLGYDNLESTKKTLVRHDDGRIWLHMGDTGYMDENGCVHVLSRGKSPRYGGGYLDVLPMENLVADAAIKGIDDEFFVVIPDQAHPGYFLPYLYVVLKDGYTVADIRKQVLDALEPHMHPVEILTIDSRPFFHFKTNRIGLTQELLKRPVPARA